MKKKITSLLLCCLTALIFGACDTSPGKLLVRPSMVRAAQVSHGLGPSTPPGRPKLARVSAPVSPQLRGVNFPGAEMWYGHNTTDNPQSGSDYLFVSHQDIDYVASKGANFVRLVFSWEGLQPTPNAPFPTSGNSGTYVSTFIERVNYATSKGLYVMVEPHGADSTAFARYKGNLVGSAAVPNSQFADLWSRIATQFKANPNVSFGLTNEPNGMSTMQWFRAAQAAIVSIRATGATNLIMVEGNGWSGAESWTSSWYDTASPQVSNATAWASTISDPLNNTVAEVHMYFDQNSGGGANDIVSATIGVERVKVTLDWARANGVRMHLGEFGANASATNAKAAVTNLLTYLDQNKDVVIGWSWWAYGPPAWWSGYTFTLDPTSNYTVDDTKMAWLQPFFVSSAPVPVPVVSPSFPTKPIAFTKNAVFTTNSGQTNWVYVPNGYDSTHNTPMTLFVWLHGCGGQSQYDVSMVSYMTNQSWITLAPGGRETTCWNVGSDTVTVLAAIADIKTHFNINPNRVILGGYSSGGDLTYRIAFYNANMFAGVLVENSSPFRDTGSTQAQSLAAASWKFNTVQLSHTSDTTYPPLTVKAELTAMTSAGFPTTYIEKAGTHYDNDSGTTGTQYDLRTFLLPHLNDGWLSPGGIPAPPAPACVYVYSAWGICLSTGTQARTVTGTSPSPCTAGPQLLSQPCTYIPPPLPLCAYTYSPWGTCQPTNTQGRTVTGTSPTPCAATTQTLTQPCVYVPPVVTDTDGDGVIDSDDKCPTVAGIKTTDGTSNGCLRLSVTAVKTYDWGTGYCKQFYFKNNNPVPMSWKTMTIYLNDGKLRGTGSVWGAVWPNATATGKVTVTPSGNAKVDPGQKSQVMGFCADYGPTKYVGSSGGLTY